jgi:hypothetical protein
MSDKHSCDWTTNSSAFERSAKSSLLYAFLLACSITLLFFPPIARLLRKVLPDLQELPGLRACQDLRAPLAPAAQEGPARLAHPVFWVRRALPEQEAPLQQDPQVRRALQAWMVPQDLQAPPV